MSGYPKLCDRYDARHKPDEVICNLCEAKIAWDPMEGDPDDLCSRHYVTGVAWDHPSQCGGELSYHWIEGARCPNCGKLDYSMPDGLQGCCSRKCMLQAEHARALGPDSTGLNDRGPDSQAPVQPVPPGRSRTCPP